MEKELNKINGSVSQKKLTGVTIFGSLIIFSSLLHMSKLVEDKVQYFEYYSYLPAWLAKSRYAFSWFQRIYGLTCGIGILFYKDIFRKGLIILGVFVISTVYWKHPYAAFLKHTQYLSHKIPGDLPFEAMTLISVIIHILLDVCFQGYLIYYLTRPNVRSHFK